MGIAGLFPKNRRAADRRMKFPITVPRPASGGETDNLPQREILTKE